MDDDEQNSMIGKAVGPAAGEFGQQIVPAGRKAGELANRTALALMQPVGAAVWGLGEISAMDSGDG